MASTLNLQTKRGDTFKQVNFQINKNEAPLDLTGSIIKMQLRKEPGGLVAYEPTLSILSGIAGTFCIDEQIINIQACNYQYDIQITTSDAEVNTWVYGIFTIIDDITR